MIFNTENIKLKIKLLGSKYDKNGVEYLKIDQTDVAVKIGSMNFNFENLFNGDKVLGELGNRLVNENIDLFLNDVEPAVKNSLSKKLICSFVHSCLLIFVFTFSKNNLQNRKSSL
jgi:flagellar motor switch protein FliG